MTEEKVYVREALKNAIASHREIASINELEFYKKELRQLLRLNVSMATIERTLKKAGVKVSRRNFRDYCRTLSSKEPRKANGEDLHKNNGYRGPLETP